MANLLPDRRRLEQAESAIAENENIVRGILPNVSRDSDPRLIRIAKTVADQYGAYPAAPANTFPIIFQDATAAGAAGQQSIITLNRSAASKALATNLMGGWIPPNTLVSVFEYRGINWRPGKVHWWISYAGTPKFLVATLCQDMPLDKDPVIMPGSAYDPDTGSSVDMTGIPLSNRRRLAAAPGFEIDLKWDARRGHYYVIQVDWDNGTPVTNIKVRWNPDNEDEGCLVRMGARVPLMLSQKGTPKLACKVLDVNGCSASSSDDGFECDLTADKSDLNGCDPGGSSSSYDCSSSPSSSSPGGGGG